MTALIILAVIPLVNILAPSYLNISDIDYYDPLYLRTTITSREFINITVMTLAKIEAYMTFLVSCYL